MKLWTDTAAHPDAPFLRFDDDDGDALTIAAHPDEIVLATVGQHAGQVSFTPDQWAEVLRVLNAWEPRQSVTSEQITYEEIQQDVTDALAKPRQSVLPGEEP